MMLTDEELDEHSVKTENSINSNISEENEQISSLQDTPQDVSKDTEIAKENTEVKKATDVQEESVQITKEEYEKLINVKKISDEEIKRARADALNFRKRVEKEKRSFLEFATGNILSKLLVISDDIKRLLENAKDQIDEIHYNAIKGIKDRLNLIYDEEGVGLIKIKKGKTAFDPRYHEAVVAVPSDEYPQNIIIDVTTNGFVAGEKILRPAKVVITKSVKKSDEKTEENEVQNPVKTETKRDE